MDNLVERTDEELIEKLEQSEYRMEDLKGLQSEIRDILKDRVIEQKLKSKIVGEYSITPFTTIRFKTPIDKAEELGAVKVVTKKSLDTKKLRALHDAGAEVPGVEISSNVRIAKVTQ